MPKRLKTVKKIFLAVVFALAASLSASGRVVKVVGSEITHSAVSEDELRRQVEFLSDSLCDGRAIGTKGSCEAAFWIMRHFSRLGFLPTGGTFNHSFIAPGGQIGRNICGILPGSGRSGKHSYILVTAHYDGLGTLDGRLFPGADSNASGVVAMLGVADMLRSMNRFGKIYGRSILFVALDGKNAGMSGSSYLWRMLSRGDMTDPRNGQPITASDISLMVNIDQIGSSMSPINPKRKDYLIQLSDGPADFHRGALRQANEKYGTGLDLCFDYYGSPDFTRLFYRRVSDQKIFLENGIPAVMFTSGITMNNNKPADTAASLDYSVFKKRIWLIFHWLERII